MGNSISQITQIQPQKYIRDIYEYIYPQETTKCEIILQDLEKEEEPILSEFIFPGNLARNKFCNNLSHDLFIQEKQTSNDFINALLYAYNKHLPVKISPDDILLILTQVISVCNNNKADRIKDDNKLIIDLNDNHKFADAFSNLMKVNSKNTYDEIFSTSTDLTKMVINMSTIKECESVSTTGVKYYCGIPSVTLTGTIKDWSKLKEIYNNFKSNTPELLVWYNHFNIIMDLFMKMRNLEASENKENDLEYIKNIWQRVITYIPCGYDKDDDYLLGGWIHLFSPFSHDMAKLMIPDNFNILDNNKIFPQKTTRLQILQNKMNDYYFAKKWDSINSSVNKIKIDYHNNDNNYRVDVYSGFVGFTFEDNHVCPSIGWYAIKTLM